MDTRFIDLFKEIAHSTELLAEKVSDSEYDNKNEETDKVAVIMRDDYAALYDRLRADGFDPKTLVRTDYAKLLVGTSIVVNNLKGQKETLETAINGYETIVMPRLQKIYTDSTDDASAAALADTLLSVEETENPNN